jgi:hypothetical protein
MGRDAGSSSRFRWLFSSLAAAATQCGSIANRTERSQTGRFSDLGGQCGLYLWLVVWGARKQLTVASGVRCYASGLLEI